MGRARQAAPGRRRGREARRQRASKQTDGSPEQVPQERWSPDAPGGNCRMASCESVHLLLAPLVQNPQFFPRLSTSSKLGVFPSRDTPEVVVSCPSALWFSQTPYLVTDWLEGTLWFCTRYVCDKETEPTLTVL